MAESKSGLLAGLAVVVLVAASWALILNRLAVELTFLPQFGAAAVGSFVALIVGAVSKLAPQWQAKWLQPLLNLLCVTRRQWLPPTVALVLALLPVATVDCKTGGFLQVVSGETVVYQGQCLPQRKVLVRPASILAIYPQLTLAADKEGALHTTERLLPWIANEVAYDRMRHPTQVLITYGSSTLDGVLRADKYALASKRKAPFSFHVVELSHVFELHSDGVLIGAPSLDPELCVEHKKIWEASTCKPRAFPWLEVSEGERLTGILSPTVRPENYPKCRNGMELVHEVRKGTPWFIDVTKCL